MLMAAIAVQGCKSDSTGPNNNGTPVENTKPNQGSSYKYYSKTTENGTVTNEDTVLYTVTADVTIGERSGVYVYTPDDGDDPRTISFEANGNISILLPYITPDSAGTFWFTIPLTGSGGTTNRLVADFEILGVRSVTRTSASLAGTENVSVNGTTYSAKKIKVTSTMTVAGQTAASDDDFFWWVPQIGFYAKFEEGGQIVDGQQEELTVETLASFDID